MSGQVRISEVVSLKDGSWYSRVVWNNNLYNIGKFRSEADARAAVKARHGELVQGIVVSHAYPAPVPKPPVLWTNSDAAAGDVGVLDSHSPLALTAPTVSPASSANISEPNEKDHQGLPGGLCLSPSGRVRDGFWSQPPDSPNPTTKEN